MTGVLGIDAAWTAKEPSGVALLEGSLRSWKCVAVAPSYDSFLSLAERIPVDWSAMARGGVPDASGIVVGAQRLLGGGRVNLIAADVPLSTVPITGRRPADNDISNEFGSR